MKVHDLIVNPAIYCYDRCGTSLLLGAILTKLVPATRARSPLLVMPAGEVEKPRCPESAEQETEEENPCLKTKS